MDIKGDNMKNLWNKYKHHITIFMNILFILAIGYESYNYVINNIPMDKIMFVLLVLVAIMTAVCSSLQSYISIIKEQLK
jgi:hypothetical protein